jgi:aminopeptidase
VTRSPLVDPRIVEHAKIVVNYSCKVKKGDFVLILSSADSIPLVREIAKEIGKVGGQMLTILFEESIARAHTLAADDDVVGALPKPLEQLVEGSDVIIYLMSSSNTKELSDIPPHKAMLAAKAFGPIQLILEKKRWNVTLHPTPALAQEAGRSFEAYSDFVYGATLVDWPEMVRKMQVLADRMAATKMVRVVGKETDITLSIEGRKPIVDGGGNNLPGGEVFTSPVEDSVNGTVYFDKPIIVRGSVLRGVRLTFKDGLITKHEAEEGGDLLEALLKTDEGAKRLGELGIGMNRGITEFSRNILFDEKMGDTIHMAVGLAFEAAGGTNKSDIHVDMIKGMKEGGAIYFDDAPIYIGGRFVWE